MDPVQTDWITHPVTWAAGLAGGMVSMAHLKGLTIWQRLSATVVGMLTAGFVTPAVAEHLRLTLNMVAAVGFLIGVSGMMITAIVVNLATKARDDPASLLDLIKAIWGRGGGGTAPPAPPVPPASGGKP